MLSPPFSNKDPTNKTHLSTTTIGLSELVMSMHDLYMMSAPESSRPKLATCMANWNDDSYSVPGINVRQRGSRARKDRCP